jgi:hypothetical protein
VNRYPVHALLVIVIQLSPWLAAQDKNPPTGAQSQPSSQDRDINVNWLYGAYVPRDVPLRPLTNEQRGQLYLRHTYLTWGIYLKTTFFAAGDQITNSPSAWGGGADAFGKRVASRYGQFAIQNTLSSAGNALLGYEPRYDRCRCSGTWARLRHALVRNFVTYNRTERERRPQLALYAGAAGAGMISSTWKPGNPSAWTHGYQAMATQAAFGSLSNLIGEFAPDIINLIKGRKKSEPGSATP